MTYADKAVQIFDQGYNCAQAIVATFAPFLNIETSLAFKIAASFGAGIGKTQKTCGAITGAAIVIGILYGKSSPSESNEQAYTATKKFMENFIKKTKSSDCIQLLGYDMNTSYGQQKIAQHNLFTTVCNKLVYNTAELLFEMFGLDIEAYNTK